jgi:hypothetical protein
MRKILLLLVIVFAVFVFLERDRLFLRDPLGTVTRNDLREDGAQVFINFHNEVLLENDNQPMYVTLVERRLPQVVGEPVGLKCIHWVACLADAYPATLAQPATPTTLKQSTNRVLEYIDAHGKDVVVRLR